ncbi:potassium channel family protein, partial [Candidatus Poribacteria bacterium]
MSPFYHIGGSLHKTLYRLKGSLQIALSEIRGKTYFGYTSFGNEVSFMTTSFSGEADFRHAIFNKKAHFLFARFHALRFDSAIFSREADFARSTFGNYTYFTYASFNHLADFDHATFDGRASLRYTVFNKSTSFEHAGFNDDMDFEHVTFKDTVDFGRAIFGGIANFAHADFALSSHFNRTSFAEPLSFDGVDFGKFSPDDLDGLGLAYRESSLFGAGHFFEKAGEGHWNAEGHSDANISFRNAKVEYEREGKYDEAGEMYVMEKESIRQYLKSQKADSVKCAWLRIWKSTSNYGESPWCFIRWLAIIVLAFALIYMPIMPNWFDWWPSWLTITFKENPFQPWGGGVMGIVKGASLNFVTALYFSAVTFATLGFGDITPANTIGRLYAIFEVLLGYLMFGVLITLVARKMTRS